MILQLLVLLMSHIVFQSMDKIYFAQNKDCEQSVTMKSSGNQLQRFAIQILAQNNRPLDFNGIFSSFVFSYETHEPRQ